MSGCVQLTLSWYTHAVLKMTTWPAPVVLLATVAGKVASNVCADANVGMVVVFGSG